MDQDGTRTPRANSDLESTSELLARVRNGDSAAVSRLVGIYAPLLRRWSHGRLPASARGLSDTDDLVQITLTRVLDQVERFDARHPGAFLAYLRRSLLNNLRNEIRNATRRPVGDQVSEELPDTGRTPLEQAIGRDALEAYEEALERLNVDQRAAVILRIELGCGYKEIAEVLGSPSANAARMLVSRALVRIARLLDGTSIRDEA